jgi:hypothetical protein
MLGVSDSGIGRWFLLSHNAVFRRSWDRQPLFTFRTGSYAVAREPGHTPLPVTDPGGAGGGDNGPPVSVPEPGTILLVAFGLAETALIGKFRS